MELGTPNGCPDRTCLERITVAQVLETVQERLAELKSISPRRHRDTEKELRIT
jgi:hypothetical protein